MKQLLFSLFGRWLPSDLFARKYPVSVKGIVYHDGKLVLLKNERDEWELPGGKLEPDESPEVCLQREIQEELNVEVEVGELIDVWVYDILGKVKVVIITYLCHINQAAPVDIRLSYEHKELGFHPFGGLEGLKMPEGYKRSIRKMSERPSV